SSVFQGPAAAEATPPRPAAPAKRQGRAASLLKSSAVMAAGTLVSRVTGFVRQLVTVAALGAAVLGDTYTVAWALPSMIYFLIIGGGLNSVFVPQLVRAMKNDADGGDAYANRLLTVVMAALAALVVAGMLAAPLLVSLQSPSIAGDPGANDVTVTFARYFLPTIFFTGVYTVIGQILNARDHFGPMMWTPVLNNVVVIFTFGMFLWVYGTQDTSGLDEDTISGEAVQLLGVGTLLGLVVQAGAMIPYLRAAGFRIRLRFDWRGHGLGKAATMAKWTVFFVLANQAALLVVTQLSTAAGRRAAEAGFAGTGFIAYNSALLIWQMPQAIITVSVMAALLPRLSRSAADGDTAAVRDDLSHGLRTSAVAIVPIAFAFLALGVPMCTLLFNSSGEESATSFGYILMAFGLGLIPYSAQYVVLRAFYAYEDTRTPFYNTVIVSIGWIVLSLACYAILPDRWVVAGIAFSYGIAYVIGVGIAWRRLRSRLRTDLDGARIIRTYIRLCGASVPAALLGGAAGLALLNALGAGLIGSVAALTVGGVVLLAVFYLAARRMRVEELTGLVGMVRSRLGR
ncbi:murein biosynthesis integral membrane protein MurJ, partial [Streptomyces mayteni]